MLPIFITCLARNVQKSSTSWDIVWQKAEHTLNISIHVHDQITCCDEINMGNKSAQLPAVRCHKTKIEQILNFTGRYGYL